MYTKEILFMFSKKILFVDDTPLFIKLAKDFFRREQVEILTAMDGHKAIEVVRKKKPDLVFMDLYMPEMDGDEACRAIKNDFDLGSTPIVIVTSSTRPEDLNRCREAGCNDIVHKPLTRDNCLATTRKFITFPKWSGKRAKLTAPVIFSQGNGQQMAGTFADISVGGAFIETEEQLPVDASLSLEFRLTPATSVIQCKARVVWLNKKSNLRKGYVAPGAGVEFLDIKKMDLFNIQITIRRLTSAPT